MYNTKSMGKNPNVDQCRDVDLKTPRQHLGEAYDQSHFFVFLDGCWEDFENKATNASSGRPEQSSG